MVENDTSVYIVDDDDAVRQSLASLLEFEGFDVREYGTADAFLSDMTGATAGVLLLDIRLPDINGLDVQAKLVAMNSKLSVIVITGHGDVPMAVQAMQAGAINFIEKPFIGDELVESVRAAAAEMRHSGRDSKEQQEIRARLDLLAPRELDVFRHLVVGRQNKVIAHELGISPRTVEVYRARLMGKMQANSLSHLVRMALTIELDTEGI